MLTKNIFAELLARVRSANEDLIAAGALPAGIDQSRVTVEPPRDAAHGDISTNAAMVLAKDAGKKPRDLAEAMAQKLRADDLVATVDVAGPGFINLTLKPAAWIEALRSAVKLGADYGKSDIGARRAGERRICLGQSDRADACRPWPRRGVRRCAGEPARVRGVRGHARILHQRRRRAGRCSSRARPSCVTARRLGENIGAIPEGLYPGDYLKPVGAALAAQYGGALKEQPEAKWLPLVRGKTIEMMMAAIRGDLAALNISLRCLLFRAFADCG